MSDIVRVCCIVGYVALGLVASWSARASADRGRRALNAFLLYTLAVSFGAGLLQRDLWPFSNWPLVAGIHGPTAHHVRLVAIDDLGTEHAIDYRALQPFSSDELVAWLDVRFLQLDPADRDRAADHLLDLVERGRLQAVREGTVGYFDRTWGPLAAPYFLLHPPLWTSLPPPARALAGLRVYRETWNLQERRVNPAAVERRVAYEYHRR